MKKIELVFRREKNVRGLELTICALSIFEFSDSEADAKWGISDYEKRRTRKDEPIDGPRMSANPTYDELTATLMEVWRGPCNTDADIVIKFEEGIKDRTPARPLAKTDPSSLLVLPPHLRKKHWVEFKRLEIPRETTMKHQGNRDQLFHELKRVMDHYGAPKTSRRVKLEGEGADGPKGIIH